MSGMLASSDTLAPDSLQDCFFPKLFLATVSKCQAWSAYRVACRSAFPRKSAPDRTRSLGYEPGNNTLFLLSDNNTSIATVGEGGGGSVSNSQCTLSGGSTAATSSGTGLTVPFNHHVPRADSRGQRPSSAWRRLTTEPRAPSPRSGAGHRNPRNVPRPVKDFPVISSSC
jgi:hypothetical protein